MEGEEFNHLLEADEFHQIFIKDEFGPEGGKNQYFLTNATKTEFQELLDNYVARKEDGYIFIDPKEWWDIKKYVEEHGFICFLMNIRHVHAG